MSVRSADGAPPPANVSLSDVPAYVGGGADAGMVKLSSNESPFAAPRFVRRALRAAGRGVNRYPPMRADDVLHSIGRRHGLAARCVTLGNGSDELMALIAHGYIGRGDEAIVAEHTFSVYGHVIRAAGATPIVAPMRRRREGAAGCGEAIDVAEVLVRLSPRTKVIFIATPNNPTGGYVSRQEMEALVGGVPSSVLIVIDHAYADFCVADDFCAAEGMIGERGDGRVEHDDRRGAQPRANVVTLRTFSKLYGIAGLRLGYALSNPQVAEQLNRLRMPFNVNSCALAAVRAAIARESYFAHRRDRIVAARGALRQKVIALGYDVLDGHGNFICLRLAHDGQRLVRFFHAHGIAIRPLHSFGLPNDVRITVGTAAVNRRVVRILARWRAAPPAPLFIAY